MMHHDNRRMRALRSAGLGVAAIVTLNMLATLAARAQEAASPAVEQVVVSSSRITTAGFNAPTPTTVLSAGDLADQAQSNVFTAITELPSLMGSTGTAQGNHGSSTGTNGLSAFGIHGVGTSRALTLIDGQRVVPAVLGGTVDISQFPQLLIQRVDIVTGGASASWGSDAVSGVVNFILDNKFSGFKANILTGISTYGDDANATMQMAVGSDFFNGKAHIVASGEYSYEAGIGTGTYGTGCSQAAGRCWYSAPGILTLSVAKTPAGLPEYTYANNTANYLLSKYGIITRGPLQGTAFAADGSPFQFNYGPGNTPNHDATGTVTGCVAPLCVGGDTTSNFGAGTTLVSSLVRGNVYTRVSYNITPETQVWASFVGSQVRTRNVSMIGFYRPDYYTIQCDNAYLPASIPTACAANKITSFQLGSNDANFQGNPTITNQRDLLRYTMGVDGAFSLFGKDWTWNSYFEHANNDASVAVRNAVLLPYLNFAVDAVKGPNGSIVCRSAAATAIGCQPVNLFGNFPPTSGALAWMQGGSLNQPGPRQVTKERQEMASVSLNGKPFELWAGPVSVATGVEYREEAFGVVGDTNSNGGPNVSPLLSTAGSNWFIGNFHSGGGNYHVSEGFVEVAVPLLDSANWGRVDLDAAGRATGYSSSGYVNTWKAGLTWDTPLDGLRFRILQSRDVRAPNLSELGAPASGVNSSVLDLTKPGVPTQVNVQNNTQGNPALKPEKSINSELGVVFQPSWLPGFRVSVDYYRLGIKGEIGSLTNQQIVQLCSLGNQAQCNALITVNGGPPQSNKIQTVLLQPFNLATVVTDGFDYEASYQFDLQDWDIPGNFVLRALATNVTKFITDSGVPTTIPVESAGANTGTVPHWKVFGTQTYRTDRFSFTVTENWISSGVFSKTFIECTTGCPLPTANNPTINYNHMPGAFYLGLGGSYEINDKWQTYFKIDNVTNLDPTPSPPVVWGNSDGSNPALYDTIGRMFHIGVRVHD
jgi:iron complex outermembrane receptor protein